MGVIELTFLATPSWDKILHVKELTKEMLIDYWVSNTLFSFNWWFLIITSIVFIIGWLWLLDKRNCFEIIFFGISISIFVSMLDLVGVTLVLWSYPDRILPILTPLLEVHRIHMPICYMLIYQFYRPWKQFIIAMTIVAFIFAFILEPITVWLGIYLLHKWSYFYSFPFYILIGILFKWIIIKLKSVESA